MIWGKNHTRRIDGMPKNIRGIWEQKEKVQAERLDRHTREEIKQKRRRNKRKTNRDTE